MRGDDVKVHRIHQRAPHREDAVSFHELENAKVNIIRLINLKNSESGKEKELDSNMEATVGRLGDSKRRIN